MQLPVRQEHSRGVDAEPLADQLPQGLVAGAGPVGENRLPVPRERRLRAVGELVDGEKLRRDLLGIERDESLGEPGGSPS